MLRFWVIREINSFFRSKTQWQMFLRVSGRHVSAHVHGHQHVVSIQISINLGKTFLRISSMRKIAVTWILARVFAYVPSFYFQILDLIYWTVLIFYFDLFWMAWHWKPAIGQISFNLVEKASATWQLAFVATSIPFYDILARACAEIKLIYVFRLFEFFFRLSFFSFSFLLAAVIGLLLKWETLRARLTHDLFDVRYLSSQLGAGRNIFFFCSFRGGKEKFSEIRAGWLSRLAASPLDFALACYDHQI